MTERGNGGIASVRARALAIAFLRVAMVVVPIGLAFFFASNWLRLMIEPGSGVPPFTDANTYLAAGERLNAGHELYSLGPGDRYVQLSPDTAGTAALLSPPPIAVLWRPLAAIPGGFLVWMAALWLSLLGTCVFLIVRVGPLAAIGVLLLAHPIGIQLASGNVAGFFPMLLVLAWRYRPTAGPIVGFMAVTKIAPGTMVGWLIGTRQWRALGWCCAIGVIALVATIAFAGAETIGEYLALSMTIKPSRLSISGLTGIVWLSSAILIGGTLLSVAIGGRRPAASFMVAVMAMVLGTPALYGSGLVTLLGAFAPFADRTIKRDRLVRVDGRGDST